MQVWIECISGVIPRYGARTAAPGSGLLVSRRVAGHSAGPFAEVEPFPPYSAGDSSSRADCSAGGPDFRALHSASRALALGGYGGASLVAPFVFCLPVGEAGPCIGVGLGDDFSIEKESVRRGWCVCRPGAAIVLPLRRFHCRCDSAGRSLVRLCKGAVPIHGASC